MINKKTVFIGGGNMAEGIIRGLINTKTMEAKDITVSEIVEARRNYLSEKYGVNVTDEPSASLKAAEVVIFAVRPQVAEGILKADKEYLNSNQLIGSIIASLSISSMEEYLGSDKHIVRIMPNVLIEARAGYSALNANKNVTAEDKQTIEEMFNAIGSTMYIGEDMFNAFTCFSDAGAAYFAYFLSGMIDAGVRVGFSRNQARAMAIDNMIGTAKMIDINNMHPMQLTDNMTSPAGVTIEATYTMDKLGLKGVASPLPADTIRWFMGIGLAVAAFMIFGNQLGIFAGSGEAMGLTGIKLVIAAVAMFLLGAFNNIGIGAFAPTTAIVYALGVSPLVAFPIMMGACSCSLAVGSAEFVKLKDYARKPTFFFLIPGVLGVLCAAYVATHIDLYYLKWIVFVVVCYAAYDLISKQIKKTKKA